MENSIGPMLTISPIGNIWFEFLYRHLVIVVKVIRTNIGEFLAWLFRRQR